MIFPGELNLDKIIMLRVFQATKTFRKFIEQDRKDNRWNLIGCAGELRSSFNCRLCLHKSLGISSTLAFVRCGGGVTSFLKPCSKVCLYTKINFEWKSVKSNTLNKKSRRPCVLARSPEVAWRRTLIRERDMSKRIISRQVCPGKRLNQQIRAELTCSLMTQWFRVKFVDISLVNTEASNQSTWPPISC